MNKIKLNFDLRKKILPMSSGSCELLGIAMLFKLAALWSQISPQWIYSLQNSCPGGGECPEEDCELSQILPI